jgi:4,5-DOPA dioxygenase extradiol
MTDSVTATGRMPALYIGHGAPPLLDDLVWSGQLEAWAGHRAGPPARQPRAGPRRPGAAYAHPTFEHYTPLFVTLGPATDPGEPGEQVIGGYWMGPSKRSLQVA